MAFEFFFATPQDAKPQLQLQVQVVTSSLAALFNQFRLPSNNHTYPAPSWASELELAGSVQVTLSTFAYNGLKQGLGLSAFTTITSNSSTLLPAFKTLRSTATKIQLTTDIFVPIFSANPNYVTLSLKESGTFALTSSIQCSDYKLSVGVSQQSAVSLSVTLLAAISSQPQPLTIGVNADWHAGTPTTFKGTLGSVWQRAFGLSWLSLSSATVTLVVGPANSVDSFSLAGSGSVSFASGASGQVSVSFATNGDYLLSVSGIPIGNSLKKLFADVTGQNAPASAGFDDITIKGGTAGFTVSTYNNPANGVKRGLTVSADVILVDSSKLAKAAQTLQASPATTTFKLTLYLPIFDANAAADFDFTLTYVGGFALTSFIQVKGYTITVDVSQGLATISLTAQVAFSSTSFIIHGQWSEQKESVGFTAALAGAPWRNPFGLPWLTLNSGNLAIEITNRVVTSASLNGVGTLSFAQGGPAHILFNFKGDGNYVVLVSGVPLTSLAALYAAVANKASPPAILNDLTIKGTLGFTLATFDSQQAKAGLTLSVQATISSTSSTLYKAAQTLQASPSTTTNETVADSIDSQLSPSGLAHGDFKTPLKVTSASFSLHMAEELKMTGCDCCCPEGRTATSAARETLVETGSSATLML